MTCQHLVAGACAIPAPPHADGGATIPHTVTATGTNPTSPHEWPAYTAAQTHEQDTVLRWRHDRCGGMQAAPHTQGRPRLPRTDAIVATGFTVDSTVSGRRCMRALRAAHATGSLRTIMHDHAIVHSLEHPTRAPVFRALMTDSRVPLTGVEADVAVDASGVATSRVMRGVDHTYGVMRPQHAWVKGHLRCGVNTTVGTRVEMHGRDARETTILPSLVDATAAHVALRDVSADTGSSSVNHVHVIAGHGAAPEMACTRMHRGAAGGRWERIVPSCCGTRQEFLPHSPKRSNVESPFRMITAKVRDPVRRQTDVVRAHEGLCTSVCHTMCCVIHAMSEVGIEPNYEEAPIPQTPSILAPLLILLNHRLTGVRLQTFAASPLAVYHRNGHADRCGQRHSIRLCNRSPVLSGRNSLRPGGRCLHGSAHDEGRDQSRPYERRWWMRLQPF